MKYIDLKEYLPPIFSGIVDLEQILESESIELRRLLEFILLVQNNFTIETADSDTLREWEDLLGITYDPNSSLEFRRQQIYLQITLFVPYTIETLKEKLNLLLTKDGYEIITNLNAQTLSVIVFRLLGANQKTVNIVEKLLLLMPPSHLGTSATLGNKWEGDTNEYYGCASSVATIYETHTTYTPENPPATWEDVLNDYGTWGDVYNSGKTWKQIYYG